MAAIAMLLAAAAHGTDASRDLNSYVLFGYEALSFKGEDGGAGAAQTRGLIVGGNVGVNAVDPHNPPGPLLNMCGGGSGHRVWMSDGSQVVADTAGLQSPCNLANLFVNRLTGGSPPVVREQGPTAFTAPIINPALLPAVPAFSPGTTAVTVESNTTVSLAPGAYGLVRVKDDGTLTLSAGTYQIDELSGGKQVHIDTVDGTVLLIATEFGVNNDANIGPACGAQIWVRSDGLGANDFSIHFSKHSEVHGQYFAPNGIVSLGDDTDLFGRFIGREVRSGWNTNVSHCLGAGGPAATSTPTLTATASATRTATASATATATRTATRTASATATATATATVVPSATATDTPLPTDTATATDTSTPTATATPTATVTATWTMTTTPIPSGALLGEVFDDASAQPLPGVAIIASAGASASSDGAGRYALPALIAGGGALTLSKDGYTRSRRTVEVTGNAAARVHDARLTPLAAAQTVAAAGGEITTIFPPPWPAPAAPEGPRIGLTVAANALAEPTAVRLTALSAQGLIAAPPLGWSVLLGVDVQAEPAPAAAVAATVRVPLTLLAAAAGAPVVAALWDDATAQWIGAAPVTATGDAVEIAAVPLPAGASAPPSTQLALLVADTVPAAPAPLVAGEPLGSVAEAVAEVDAALVTAAPPAIVSGPGTGALVLMRVDAPAPLPSGTRLEAQLRETFDLRDGRRLLGTRSRQDVVGYQYSATGGEPLPSPGALGAALALVPSRSFGLGALREGRVLVEVRAGDDASAPGVIDAAGGVVSGAGGVTLAVPPGAASAPVVIDVQPIAGDALPGAAGARPDFAGALSIDVNGGVLDPLAAYGLGFGTTIADGRRFAIARLDIVEQRSVLVFVGTGHSSGGAVVVDACPSGLASCLAGLEGSGTYAAFDLAADAALVTGTVRDGSSARAGLAVASDTGALIAVTTAAGVYALPAPAATETRLTCRDRANDLDGTASVTPAATNPAAVVSGVDIQLAPTPPQVIHVSPPNHGSDVSRSTVIAIAFSEPIAAVSISDSSVRLLRVGAGAPVAVAVRRSLSSDGTELVITPSALLEPDTLYRLELSAAVTDRTETALEPFASDLTTALTFSAAALPPNTLRVSLPDDDGRVFVCGGAQLAVPGTLVDVVNDTTGELTTVVATDLQGDSGSDVCDALFPTRCDTSQPGSFCGVVSGIIGERVQVQVEDPFGDLITLDAGNMRDERTGATAIGADGGEVSAVADPAYRAVVPANAFSVPTIVTVAPIANVDFPVPLGPGSGLSRVAALSLDLGPANPVAAEEIDLSVPAPPGFDPEAQVLVGYVINFRGVDELTLVDNASLSVDPAGQPVLSTNSPPFAGPRRSGRYDFSTPNREVGYVTGVVDKANSTGDVLPSSMTYVFPYLDITLEKFVMPVVANEPAVVSLVGLDGTVHDSVSIIGPPKNQFASIGGLTDSDAPAVVGSISVPGGEQDVPTDERVILDLSRPVAANADGSLPPGAIDVRDQNGNVIPGVWFVVSDDFRRVQFFPSRPLPLGTQITVSVVALAPIAGDPFVPFSSSFFTFQPKLVGSAAIPANDVDLLRLDEGDGIRPYAIVARDADVTNDSFGGVASVDIADPYDPHLVGEVATPGIDRAVRVISDSSALVASVNGAGLPQRYGELLVHDFSTPAAPVQRGRRVLNLSPQAIQAQIFLDGIPFDGGVPRSLAMLGTDTVYVANPPTIGVQQETISSLIPPNNEVEGIYTGGYRAVAVLGTSVLAAGPKGDHVEIVSLSPDLTQVRGQWPLFTQPLEIITAAQYPIDLDHDGNLGDAEDLDGDAMTAAAEAFDLVVVVTLPHELTVLRLMPDGSLAGLSTIQLPEELGVPRGGAIDPQLRTLYVACGTAGLALLDFHDPLQPPPGGSLLTTVPIPGASRRVRLVKYSGDATFALVASSDGLYVVEVAPPRVRFVGARETSNPINSIINRVAKYDPPTATPPPYGLPINMLYMVAADDDGQFHARLDLASATVPQDTLLWGIYDSSGAKVADGRMPAVGSAPVDFGAAGLGLTRETYNVRFGIEHDEDGDSGFGHLEVDEWVPSADQPKIAGIPTAQYVAYRTALDAVILASLQRDIFDNPFFPITATALTIFRTGLVPPPVLGMLPPTAVPETFHYDTDPFSNWLSHNAGADFEPAVGVAPLARYVWDAGTPAGQTVSERIATSDVIVADLCQIIEDNRTAIENPTTVGPVVFHRLHPTALENTDCPPIPVDGTFPCNPENVLPYDPGNLTSASYRVLNYPGNLLSLSNVLPSGKIRSDLGGTFGRVRVQHQVTVVFDGGSVVDVESNGRIDDLYDFNFETGLPANLAAAVQLGYSTRPPVGRIYKNTVSFSHVWSAIPCPGW